MRPIGLNNQNNFKALGRFVFSENKKFLRLAASVAKQTGFSKAMAWLWDCAVDGITNDFTTFIPSCRTGMLIVCSHAHTNFLKEEDSRPGIVGPVNCE
jgi:hypothetical protein